MSPTGGDTASLLSHSLAHHVECRLEHLDSLLLSNLSEARGDYVRAIDDLHGTNVTACATFAPPFPPTPNHTRPQTLVQSHTCAAGATVSRQMCPGALGGLLLLPHCRVAMWLAL